MGLLDKVKAQATAATEMAKDAAAKGQAKMNEAQAKKAADGMLRDLGAAFYATKTGRSTPTTDGESPSWSPPCRRTSPSTGRSPWRPSPPRPPRRLRRPGRLGGTGPAPAPEGGRPVVPAATAAHGADAVARPVPSGRRTGDGGHVVDARRM